MSQNEEDDPTMLNLIQDVEKIAHTISSRKEEISEVSKKLRVRRLENHFSADIARLLRGER